MTATSTFLASDGEGYERQMGRWSRRLAEPFIDFCGVADDETVLDLGCGVGSLSFALAQRARIRSVCGIDLSPAYIEYASRRNRDARIEFRTGDACALAFADAAFDRTLSLLVLHFVPQAERAIQQMRRVTRPGGTVAAAVWDARGGFVANRIFFDTSAMLDPKANERRARNYTRPMTRPGELENAWRAAGMVDVRQTMLTIPMVFAAFDDYWAPYVGKDGPGAEYLATLAPERPGQTAREGETGLSRRRAGWPRSFAATAWAVKGRAPN